MLIFNDLQKDLKIIFFYTTKNYCINICSNIKETISKCHQVFEDCLEVICFFDKIMIVQKVSAPTYERRGSKRTSRSAQQRCYRSPRRPQLL